MSQNIGATAPKKKSRLGERALKIAWGLELPVFCDHLYASGRGLFGKRSCNIVDAANNSVILCRMIPFDEKAEHLDGKLLIAMPSMGDTRFNRSVICICAHSKDGAMGLIVNKPAKNLNFGDLLEQLAMKTERPIDTIDVHFGGPVELGRGFVLHSRDYEAQDATLNVSEIFGMTATLDILDDISQGVGPAKCLLALGYAGWGPGQLEEEIRDNGWLTCDASAALVFSDDHDGKWKAAMDVVGIDPRMLSSAGGSA